MKEAGRSGVLEGSDGLLKKGAGRGGIFGGEAGSRGDGRVAEGKIGDWLWFFQGMGGVPRDMWGSEIGTVPDEGDTVRLNTTPRHKIPHLPTDRPNHPNRPTQCG